MSSVNKRVNNLVLNHEGGKVVKATNLGMFKRTCLSCLLWEDTFYESGEDIFDRIVSLSKELSTSDIKEVMYEAKLKQNIRHLPLLLLTIIAERRELKADYVYDMCTRTDDITELLSLYWKDGKKAIPKQMKLGLQKAFTKFDEYQLAKYRGKGKEVKLSDVMKLVRPKPADKEQAELWGKLIHDELKTPDTWEVALSGGADKKEAFTRLLKERKLGALALLRNLRNMTEAGVDDTLIKESILKMNVSRINPYQFIVAGLHALDYQKELEDVLLRKAKEMPKIKGKTVIMVDNSGSMYSPMSARSDTERIDVATSLAILLQAVCEDSVIYAFSNSETKIGYRTGFALDEAIKKTECGGTWLSRSAARIVNSVKADRLVVVTDEQSMDGSVEEGYAKNYIINIAGYSNGINYNDNFVHISGMSNNFIDYMLEYEAKYM